MDAKGTTVKSIPSFVKDRFPNRYTEWLESLSEKSQKIYKNPILATDWYSLEDGIIAPTKQLGRLFYNDTKKGAWECGRYSADTSLTGVYRVFIKASTPFYIIDRGTKILSTYYQPCSIHIADKKERKVTFQITEFPTPEPIVEYRIAGWMERALEINNCKEVKVLITQSLARGNEVTEFVVSWGG